MKDRSPGIKSLSYALSRIFDSFSALSRKKALLSLLMDVHALTVNTFVFKRTRNQLTFLNKLTVTQLYRIKCGHDWRGETLKQIILKSE